MLQEQAVPEVLCSAGLLRNFCADCIDLVAERCEEKPAVKRRSVLPASHCSGTSNRVGSSRYVGL